MKKPLLMLSTMLFLVSLSGCVQTVPETQNLCPQIPLLPAELSRPAGVNHLDRMKDILGL